MTSLGLQFPNFSGFDPSKLFGHIAGLATAAEDSGFDSVWVMDHYLQLPPLGGPDQPMLEAYTLLGALAARTQRVTLGTLVTGVTYRNPGLLAKIITTLDVVSQGRAILGIGGAWYDVEHKALGVEYPSDRVRLDMLEEAVQVCRAMFTGDDVSYVGKHYRLDHARNQPRPVQAGGPKIMIGGGGEKRTLRLVAQYADKCNVTGDVKTLARKIEVLHRHCAEVGRDPAEVGITWMTPLILTTSEQNTAEVRDMLSASESPDEVAGFTVGQPQEIPNLVAGHIEAGASEVIFSVPFVDQEAIRALGQAFGRSRPLRDPQD
ncbi:MAG TPA: LLM class F420-dependent oxidoreductase [Acidimicrobiales bacterium]|nr:LLM class F420-dependent oxidoreductase [Acidimicrobiales bacterium]